MVCYMSSLCNIILKHGLEYQVYADDTPLYSVFDSNQEAANKCISRMEACVELEDIRQWMNDKYLKLNDNKTEFILIGSKNNLNKITIPHIKIGDSTIAPVSQVCNLGVFMDSTMTLVPHI